MTRRKPRGEIGYTEIGSNAAYYTVPLPDSKEEIEQWILGHALFAARASASGDPYQLVAPPIRNAEADFDFTLFTSAGTQYLDLLEIVILPKGAHGYNDGRPVYDAEAMAQAVFQKIAKKSKHYGKPRSATHLLLYSTDWRFRLVGTVVRYLVLLLARRGHIFSSISYFTPDDEDSGEFLQLYPVSDEVMAEYARWHYTVRQGGHRQLIIIMDPRTARPDGNGTVFFANPLAPQT